MSISASDVKALRESTGAGMMDCKKALTEANGDAKRAVELLRERGLSKAGKRAGRETGEGAVGIAISGNQAVLIELGCETDFVAKTDDFQALAARIAERVMEDAGITDVESALAASMEDSNVAETIQGTAGKVGENIELKRVGRVGVEKGVAGGYVHAGGKLGVIVAIEGAEGDAIEAAAKDLAMHVAAVDPTPVAIDRDGVPADLLESEKAILRKQAMESGKPENIVDKIVEGRIGKFYAENCLLEQAFVKDPDVTVGKMIEGVASGARVTAFQRFKLGEAS